MCQFANSVEAKAAMKPKRAGVRRLKTHLRCDRPRTRLGVPDDVASLALFLASAEASYLTGQALNVTGGMVMH